MQEAIKADGLGLVYGSGGSALTALESIDLSIKKGEIFGFLGPNGAGKTTTIKLILGLMLPSAGRIRIFGNNPSLPGARKNIGFMPETANYYWYLTPFELLKFYGNIFGVKKNALKERINSLLELVGLSERKNSLMRTFSKGMLQKLNLAQSLINDPDLLILDEPTTGLDPIAKMKMRDILIDLRKKGKTIFFSSHELSEVEIISDKVAILKRGRLLKEAVPQNLLNEKGERVTLDKYFFDLVKG